MTSFIHLGILASLAVAASAQTTVVPRAAASFVEEEVVIPAGQGRQLAGTLTIPSGSKAPVPVAVTITGSGAHLRDGNRTAADRYRPFREIAAALGNGGIATLRLDDRGAGASTGNSADTDGDDVADDVTQTIEWLRRDPRFDPSRVILIGHSFGGAVAPIVAAADNRIAAVVLMGAPARNFRETMQYQLAYVIGRDKSIEPRRRAAALETAMRQQERNAATSAERWRPWLQNYDPLPIAARVKAPVLILHGTTDRAVPLTDAQLLQSTMTGAGNPRVTLRVFEGLNHHFQRDSIGAREGYPSLPTQALATEFLADMVEWLQLTLQKPAAPGKGSFASGQVSVAGQTYPYSVWLPPGFDRAKRMPAVLVLHGAGSRGTDGVAPRTQSVVDRVYRDPAVPLWLFSHSRGRAD